MELEKASGRSDLGVVIDYKNGHNFFSPLHELLYNVTLHQHSFFTP